MTIAELKELRAAGKFHHATYRNQGRLWEGLWVYENDEPGPNHKPGNWHPGYKPAGAFFKDSPELDAAYAELSGTGISLGRYGAG
jgi:hypothetical protein